jgi:hypothetical protein
LSSLAGDAADDGGGWGFRGEKDDDLLLLLLILLMATRLVAGRVGDLLIGLEIPLRELNFIVAAALA